MRTRVFRALAAFVALGLLAVACGDDSTSDTNAKSDNGQNTTATTGQPQSGGTIAFGSYSETAGLDPIVSTGQGTTGAIEMAAVYDTILRYDTKSGKYVMGTAESVSANADATEWTVKLKPNIKFHDGTDYDAEAVKFGMNRHRSGLPGAPACAEIVACPRNATSSGVYMALVKDIQAVDKLTVKFILNEPWAGFDYALSAEPSMIPSPTALKKCDATKDVRQCEFNLKAVGAGPFVVDSFKPKDSISLTRNPNYWGGQVYLDGLKFVTFNDTGGSKTLDAFNTGQIQGAFLRDPTAVSSAHKANIPGFTTMEQGGGLFLLNSGVTVTCAGGKPEPVCTGKPDGPTSTNPATKDPKVRQAVAAALDPKVIDQRGNQGNGLPGSELLQKSFRWYPNVSGPKYDPEAAKKLVTEAKAAGWDGKIRLLFNTSPLAQNVGLTVETQLRAVGMDPQLDTTKDVTAQISQVATAKDFDLSTWGLAIAPDDGAMWALAQNLSSTSPSNRVGFKSAAVDQALKDLRTAKTDADKTAGYKKIAEAVATDLPFYVWSAIEEYTIFTPKVHGVQQANRAMVFFDKAWMDK